MTSTLTSPLDSLNADSAAAALLTDPLNVADGVHSDTRCDCAAQKRGLSPGLLTPYEVSSAGVGRATRICRASQLHGLRHKQPLAKHWLYAYYRM
ncbi:hypothetical protein J6590_019097 [Homalodisca vitripennis]|nr:hypothetical protein J6590_019097 [Homalodisca vitripennis]